MVKHFFLKMTLLSSQVHEVAPSRGRTSVWHCTPRPKDPLDPALFCQLVPENKPQSQRVPIFCKVGCLATVVADSHPPETQTIFLILIFSFFWFGPGRTRTHDLPYARQAPYP